MTIRTILLFDAFTCLLMGVGLILGAGPLSTALALPASFLLYAGIILLPISAFMAWVGSRPIPPKWGVDLVVWGNAAWVVVSLGLPLVGWIAPNLFGLLFILAQAIVITVVTWLEFRLSKSAPAAFAA